MLYIIEDLRTFIHYLFSLNKDTSPVFGNSPSYNPIVNSDYQKRNYHHGKEWSYRENKMCSETSEAVGTNWELAQLEIKKFLKIRITLPCHS